VLLLLLVLLRVLVLLLVVLLVLLRVLVVLLVLLRVLVLLLQLVVVRLPGLPVLLRVLVLLLQLVVVRLLGLPVLLRVSVLLLQLVLVRLPGLPVGVGESGGEADEWSVWLRVAVALGRPTGITRQRYTVLQGTSSAQNQLLIPYKGFPFAFNSSFLRPLLSQCVTAEWRHTSRLLAQHLRDKPHKVLVWSFEGEQAPVSFNTFFVAYSEHKEASGLDYHSVDQSDRAQSDNRAVGLSNFGLVSVLASIPGGMGSACACLVHGCYVRIFVDVTGQAPLSMGDRLVLGMFYCTAMVAQRLMVMQTKGYTLKINSYTRPTVTASIMHVANVVAMLARHSYAGGCFTQSLVPQSFGEWLIESLFSSVRDPNNTCTSNVTLVQFLERLAKVADTKKFEAENLGYWRSVVTKKTQRTHSQHPNEHTSYNVGGLTQLQVYEALHLGWLLFLEVSNQHGYGPLFAKYPSFAQLYAAYLEKTRPDCGPVSFKDIKQFVGAERADVSALAAVAADCATVKQRYSAELQLFFAACDVVRGRSVAAAGGAGGVDAGAAAVGPGAVGVSSAAGGMSSSGGGVLPSAARAGDADEASGPVSSTLSTLRQARSLVAAQNFGRARQSRDLLARYAASGSQHVSMVKAPQHESDEVVSVGSTYAMLFARGPRKGPPLRCLLVASTCWLLLVHAVGDRVASSIRNCAIISVPKADPTAPHLCHPYALVQRHGVQCVSESASEGDCESEGEGEGEGEGNSEVTLAVTKEVHMWLPCCESLTPASCWNVQIQMIWMMMMKMVSSWATAATAMTVTGQICAVRLEAQHCLLLSWPPTSRPRLWLTGMQREAQL